MGRPLLALFLSIALPGYDLSLFSRFFWSIFPVVRIPTQFFSEPTVSISGLLAFWVSTQPLLVLQGDGNLVFSKRRSHGVSGSLFSFLLHPLVIGNKGWRKSRACRRCALLIFLLHGGFLSTHSIRPGLVRLKVFFLCDLRLFFTECLCVMSHDTTLSLYGTSVSRCIDPMEPLALAYSLLITPKYEGAFLYLRYARSARLGIIMYHHHSVWDDRTNINPYYTHPPQNLVT